MSSFWQDLRYAFRTLSKSKGFTAIAVLTLAVGIGINAAVFTITNASLFKGFSFDKNDRIVYLGSRDTRQKWDNGPVSYPDLRDWRAQAKSFNGLAAATGTSIAFIDNTGLPEFHFGARMTANAFQVIGQKPIIGRDFTAADELPGAPPVAILTYGFWDRRFGKDPSIVGRSFSMSGIYTTVVGVMPKGLVFPYDLDIWIVLGPRAETEKREFRNLIVFGRLADGMNIKGARAEIDTINHNLQKDYPNTNQSFVPVVLSYNQFYFGDLTTIFSAMMAAVVFVLLIACANVANLLLARAVGRSREISIRIALGAGRWRLVRQLLVESLLLSSAGGVFGWLIAVGAVHIFKVLTVPFNFYSWIDYSMDWRVLAYLVAASIGTGVLFGLVPALRLSKLDVNSALKEGGRGTSAGAHSRRLSGILVVSEMALAIVLLAGAGLMIRSFLNVFHATLGVKTDNVLVFRITLPQARYKAADEISFHDRLHERLTALPGVESAAIALAPPTGGSMTFPYELEGSQTDDQHRPSLSALLIGPDYFHVMGVGVLQGRAFTDQDGVSGPPVVIVNEQFAAKFWPGQNAIGKRLRLFGAQAGVTINDTSNAWLTVVGIVPNIVQNDISPRQIDPLIYLPFRQQPGPLVWVLARTRVPPETLGTAFRKEIQALDPGLPVFGLGSLDQNLLRNSWFYRVFGVMFVMFAAIALLLASVGLYALMAHSVNQRTQEIGVRMAMGASAGNIRGLVMLQGMRQVAIGLVIGLVGAFLAMRVLRTQLVQVSPADPGTFVFAAAILTLAAVLGCFLPARRATKVDPMVALRYE
jgi:putative ABC transport system permease protein